MLYFNEPSLGGSSRTRYRSAVSGFKDMSNFYDKIIRQGAGEKCFWLSYASYADKENFPTLNTNSLPVSIQTD